MLHPPRAEAHGAVRQRVCDSSGMSTPPKSDPLATILGSSEWLSRPRAGAKDGAPHPPPSSSPTEREGRREHWFDRQLEQRGGVWLGHLRLSDEPWRPRAARRAGSLPTHGRDERLPGRQAHVEGNSSRDTSLSDDGSGASDGAGEVTFDENTSEHVDGTHDGVMLQSGPMVVSHGERVARDG